MTAPNADQQIDTSLAGGSPGNVLAYQYTSAALGRVTYSSEDNDGPYTTEFEVNNPVVGSAATYDQVKSLLTVLGSRHIDPLGDMPNPKKAWMLQWYWMMDGCPTPLTRARRDLYIKLADTLRPWPQDVVDAFAAKGYHLPASEASQVKDYSTINRDTTLDNLS